ncbi:MAG: hypothetical protein C4331_08390 [Meiothermus sp.]
MGSETIILSGAAGAIVQGGKILLTRHGLQKKRHIPGGVQEVGESIQDTVCREIKEELALELRVKSLVSVYSDPRWTLEYPNGDRVQQLLFFFLMEGPIGPIRLQEEEITAYRFFELDAVPEDTMEC